MENIRKRYFHPLPLPSFMAASGLLVLFLIGAPLLVSQTRAVPVFQNWRSQPMPSGNPMRVQEILNGSFYHDSIDILVFQFQQLTSNPPIDL